MADDVMAQFRREVIEPRRAASTAIPTIDALCLPLAEWLQRDIPAPDFLLGEWVSTTSRAMLVAPTGLGKTNFAMGLGFAIAAGIDFLHWRSQRAARVLYIDGEMSRRLVKIRLADAARRLGNAPAGFFILCSDDVKEMPPLNSGEGQAFIDDVVETIGGIDFIVFDNVMSLLSGDMKDEEGWQQTLPWVRSLTRRNIGQLWVHHTGHDEGHSYGTKTREWQIDTVILLERIEDGTADIAFKLSFTKSRERAPHNRADFEPATIRLVNDRWNVEGAQRSATGKPPSPKAQAFYRALINALTAAGETRSDTANRPSVRLDQWKAACARLGLLDLSGDDRRTKNAASALFSKNRLDLIAAGWVVCNGEFAWSLRGLA